MCQQQQQQQQKERTVVLGKGKAEPQSNKKGTNSHHCSLTASKTKRKLSQNVGMR